ncbi:MAG: glycine--tRNA ligase subunit beta, partial [Buchnera aphidicola]|nr:glycine--tRNA ligase subunit beta [Buchnera aphidicola]
FLQKDREKKLESYLIHLKNVIFQKSIGTLYDKTMRIKLLVKWIAYYTHSNIKNSIRAAILSKCDLISNMVCEFPELQGIIGMYYAIADQEHKHVAKSIREQYLPSYSEDKLPSTIIGCTLSIADKIDTLLGFFIAGKIPTAD